MLYLHSIHLQSHWLLLGWLLIRFVFIFFLNLILLEIHPVVRSSTWYWMQVDGLYMQNGKPYKILFIRQMIVFISVVASLRNGFHFVSSSQVDIPPQETIEGESQFWAAVRQAFSFIWAGIYWTSILYLDFVVLMDWSHHLVMSFFKAILLATFECIIVTYYQHLLCTYGFWIIITTFILGGLKWPIHHLVGALVCAVFLSIIV